MFYEFKPTVKLKWVTPEADRMIADMARVSVKNQEGKEVSRLIKYMADHGHNSPFDMVNMCVEVWAVRDVSRQILRHWTIHPQEFSQRYAEIDNEMFCLKEARLQHPTNRQMSIPVPDDDDTELKHTWEEIQLEVLQTSIANYKEAIDLGIAKEVARSLLPEGLTMSRMYLNGTARSWIYYLKSRLDANSTQKEHVAVAEEIKGIFMELFPHTYTAFFII